MSPTAHVAEPPTLNRTVPEPPLITESTSGLAWGGALAGAVAATALSFILLVLGVGLGLSSVSPWRYEGVEGGTLAVSAIVWVTFTQVMSSGLGGYLAGRLRGRWARVRSSEVFFRDTAQGLVAWSVATLVMVGVMGSAVGNVLGAATRTAGAVASGASNALSSSAGESDMAGYWVDTLLRADPLAPAASPDGAAVAPAPERAPAPTEAMREQERAQALRVWVNALRTGAMPDEDVRFLAQLVFARTGLPPDAAERRVRGQLTKARQALTEAQNTARQHADDARRASAYTALWMFVALLAGAFVAAWMATFGGRHRDAAALGGTPLA
ncbi:hypothetical protein [uncultured Aquabacterium sp.]|uniref:hypothetical protein n=1 Tax=uncultured Aquabacterium sp. TaxID=158753 RepID=UPI0025F9DAFE|nr:hypothetical protein [uncultured Aquabacterium sp.]